MTALPSEIEAKPKVNPLLREHQKYYIGKKQVPGVTTIIDQNLGWKYPALLGWTKKQLRQGIDPDASMKEAGTVGTLVHAMIEAKFSGQEVDRRFFSEAQYASAMYAYGGFEGWWDMQRPDVVGAELQIVHKSLRYGGTIDLLCSSGVGKRKVLTLIDFKSSSAIYLDHRIQASAYQQLVLHKYKKVPEVIILHLNKETGMPTPHPFSTLAKEWEVFKLCLRLQKIHSLIK